MLGGRFFAASLLLSACGEAPIELPSAGEPQPEHAAVETASGSGEAYTPEVILAVPASTATVRPDVVVKLLFSMPMDTAITSAAFEVTDAAGEPVTGTLSWDVTAMVSAFRPHEPLAEGPYRATVDGAACNAEGIELAEPFSSSFQVHQPSSQNDKPYAG